MLNSPEFIEQKLGEKEVVNNQGIAENLVNFET
jgi:hypothetical protein